MESHNSFAVVNDETLSTAIGATTEVLVYVAPGITEPLVAAMSRCLEQKPNLSLSVVIDLDPEVYRLGYGTEAGLRALQQLAGRHHIGLRQQPGLRIGLLVTDHRTLVYAPTPLLIEAGSTTEEKPNAIIISRQCESTAKLMYSCAAIGWSESDAPPIEDAEIGQEPAWPEQVAQSLSSLEDTPPKQFDVARTERVFESKIQFVELELANYRLSSKRIRIPNDLLIGEDESLQERLHNSFKLLQGEIEISAAIPDFDPKTGEPRLDHDGNPRMTHWTEQDLEQQRKALYKDFLINVPHFGHVIMRSNRKVFDARLLLLKKQIAAYGEAVKKDLELRVNEAITTLVKALLPKVKENPPQRYKKTMSGSMSDEVLAATLQRDLEKDLANHNHLFNPDLRCVYKDVTYESIGDESFRSSLESAMRNAGGEAAVNQLFYEHDAAPEAKQGRS